ncbi:MAG TPA: GxxExxY protein [bacterium]|nr:GxxExxY protein [bacterium]
MTELLYKDLSFKLTGLVFEINNEIGYGQSEKTYCDAFEKLLRKENISYKRENYFPVSICGEVVKREYFDFLIEEKVVVEFKISEQYYKRACTQVFKYLKSSGMKLGLIYRFTKDGVRAKRIPNYY